MKTVYYAGLDVHKETIVASVYQNNNEQPFFEKTFSGDGLKVLETLKELQLTGEVYACYESGCMGFTLQRLLSNNSISCVISAASKMLRRSGERIKTDTRDARNLALQLRAGVLPIINIPTIDDEGTRDFLRARDDIKDDLKRTRQRILKFILRNGYRYSGTSYWTQKHREWMKTIPFITAMQQETFDAYLQHMEELEDRVRLMDERVQEISQTDRYRKHVNHLRCLKGIDYQIALSLMAEVGDFRRFKKAEAFMAFLGLVPTEHSSGDKRFQGSITKTGNGHLRRLLIESSWHYRKRAAAGKRLTDRRKGQEPEVIAYADKALRRLQRKFLRLLYRGKPNQVAATAVARELAGFIWGLMTGNIA